MILKVGDVVKTSIDFIHPDLTCLPAGSIGKVVRAHARRIEDETVYVIDLGNGFEHVIDHATIGMFYWIDPDDCVKTTEPKKELCPRCDDVELIEKKTEYYGVIKKCPACGWC
jgi:hypothetical protein